MANKFEIQVVALDKFTNIFRKLNSSASQALRPATRAQRQFAALGRELHLDKITRGFRGLSQATQKVATNLGLTTGPLQVLFGLGAAGGIAGTAAAIAALGVRWGNMGYEINRTSQSIGVSTADLQRYRGAAKLAGVSQEALTAGFESLGTTLQDAENGRNASAYTILNSLGIGIKKTKDGVVDTVGTFRELSRAIASTNNPQVQELIANAFGLKESLPLLRQGPEALGKLLAEAEKFSAAANGDALAGAQKFGDSMNRLKLAIEGVANAWGQQLTPLLTRGADISTKALSSGGIGSGLWDFFSGKMSRDFVYGNGEVAATRRSSGVVSPDAAAPAAGNLPLGLRQNNPGNLRSWGGVPSEGGFARFASAQDGLNAMAQQLGLYGNRDGLRTVSGILNKYAPPSENDTGSYIADVARQTGFSPDQQLDVNDPKVLAPLLSAMVKHEQGQQPFSQDQLTQAAQSVQINVAIGNAPPGTRVTSSGSNGSGAPAMAVSYSLPPGDLP
jgi:hypothetical protein